MKLQIHSVCWYVSKTVSESPCLCYRNSCLALSDDVLTSRTDSWCQSVCLFSPMMSSPISFLSVLNIWVIFSIGCFLSQRFWLFTYNYYYYQSNLIWQKAVRMWWYVLCSKLLTAHCCHNQYILCRPVWLQHVASESIRNNSASYWLATNAIEDWIFLEAETVWRFLLKS